MLKDIHLRDEANENAAISERTLFFLWLIALFIMSIAWLNYINLSTAQALKRAKEVGIRKVVGACRAQLVEQFLLEAFVVNTIALILAIIISFIVLPMLNSAIDKSVVFGLGVSMDLWFTMGGIFVLGTLLSGFYPALVLSGFKPAVVVKGTSFLAGRKFGLRQGLVVIQLVIGVFLISGTLAIYRQLQYMRNRDIGMNIERVISFRGPKVFADEEQMEQRLQVFK